MRFAYMLIIAAMAGGCATGSASRKTQACRLSREYREAPAGALAFTPPVAYGQPPITLDRDDRAPSLFLGYEQFTTTYFNIYTDDRQTDDGTGYYIRRAVIGRTGVWDR